MAMRCAALTEVMYGLRDCFDWKSGRLQAATALGEVERAGEARYDAAASPADLLNAPLRSICLRILQVLSENCVKRLLCVLFNRLM